MKKNILALIATFIWMNGFACTCKVEGNFLKMAKKVDLVAVVRVVGYGDSIAIDMGDEDLPIVKKPETLIFSVIKILKGSDNRKELKVFGDDGQLCRPNIRDFKKDEYYVIALYKCDGFKRITGVLETPDYYSVSICGQYSIHYSPANKTVKGVINKKRKASTMTLEKLEILLKED